MRLQALVVTSILLASLPCCTGVRFSDISLNATLPDDYRNRTLWEQTDAFKYDLTQLAGHVIVGDLASGQFSRGARILPDDYSPTLNVIDKGVIYTSKVNKDAALKGSYLVFAADLHDNQMAEVTIVDTSRVFIPWQKVPFDALKTEATRYVSSGQKAYYVQGALLATITKKDYAKISADASAVRGDTFGAEGSVFNELSSLHHDFRISLTLIDMAQLAVHGFDRPNEPTSLHVNPSRANLRIKNIHDVPLVTAAK